MLFHGSPVEFEIGHVLRAGSTVGMNTNGGCSAFLYATGDFGFSVTDTSDWGYGKKFQNIREFAVWNAMVWGATKHGGWLYIVEGDLVGFDPHHDSAPGSYQMREGVVVAKFPIHVSPEEGVPNLEETLQKISAWEKLEEGKKRALASTQKNTQREE